MITGVLSISNGMRLNYPIPPVLLNLSGLCDRVVVGVDPNFELDRKIVEAMNLPNVECIDSAWNRSVSGGNEIAIQMDKLIDYAQKGGAEWVAVLQADELFHEKDFSMLRRFIERSEDNQDGTTAFSFERLYFWGALNKVRQDWNARLIRLFKPGFYSFMADNTDKGGMFAGEIKPGKVVDLSYYIYHYSRIGDPAQISARIRNLDTFFHKEDDLVPKDQVPDYDFKGREFDNYSVSSPPPEKEAIIVDYKGSHPLGVVEWYE